MMSYRSLTDTLLRIVNIQLKGIGQIMLQESPWTGFLFLAGLAVGNWQWAAAAFLATAIGTLTAELLNFDKKNLRAGLYGFSPALVGVALLVFFKSTLLLWILVLIGAAAAAALQEFFLRRNFPAYTFPFIAVTWLLVFIVRNYASVPPSELVQNELTSVYDTYTYGFKGIGQVIFQEKLWVGVIFFIGIFIHSPISALFALAASFVAGFLAHLTGQPWDNIHQGVFGFNAALSAIVFAGRCMTDVVWAAIAVLITVLINVALVETNVLAPVGGVLTFAFVTGTWLTLLLQKLATRYRATRM